MALKLIELTPSVSASIDGDWVRQSERAYKAWFDPGDDENYVMANCGLGIGLPHPSDPRQICLGLKVQCLGQETYHGDNSAALAWSVTASFGLWNPLEHTATGNPLDLPLRFRLDFTGADVPIWEDVDGNPLVNAAGDYYDPPIEEERLHATLTVLRNESGVDPAALAALSNTTNEAEWNGFAPETVRLMPIKIPFIAYSQSSHSYYWPMEYQFEINFDTWIRQVLNQGYRQLDGSGNLVPIFVNGQPIDSPVMLDEAGKAILHPDYVDSGGDTPPGSDPGGTSHDPDGGGEPPEGGTGTDDGATSGAVVINAYRTKRTHDFSVLDMDNIFTLPALGA